MDGEFVKRSYHNCLRLAVAINRVFSLFTSTARVLVLPQHSPYQQRVYYSLALQLFAHEQVMLVCAKVFTVYFNTSNFMVILSVGSLLPFLQSVAMVFYLIPCPPMASIASNLMLFVVLATLVLLGLGTYSELWTVYIITMGLWPWLVVASMVSRLYIERVPSKNPFSPVRDLPLLGCLGAFGHVLALMAVKEITITDTIALTLLDPIICALVGSAMITHRFSVHVRQTKIYTLLFLLVCLYRTGDMREGGVVGTPVFKVGHGLFLASRCLFAIRSFFVKWSYIGFYRATFPTKPSEDESLFGGSVAPKQHRFKRFPESTLFTLDAIFDSGLRDMDLHGMGPLGTRDLYRLTEMCYMLPISSMMAWAYEPLGTNHLDGTPKFTQAQTAAMILSSVSDGTKAEEVREIRHDTSVFQVGTVLFLFCLARILAPYAASNSLFDAGSSVHSWRYQPVLLLVPFFLFDALYLNRDLTKFQMVILVSLVTVCARHRDYMWDRFKRKMYLLMTQEFAYLSPAYCRTLHRGTLVEGLAQTSTDDYGVLLMDTVISSGTNIRELARDTRMRVWDRAPAATAAWKLAFSLVTKWLKRNNYKKRAKEEHKEEMRALIGGMVSNIVEHAEEICFGEGSRLRKPNAMMTMFRMRYGMNQLKANAGNRRQLLHMRQTGELKALADARAASPLALADGSASATGPPQGRGLLQLLPPQPKGQTSVEPGDAAKKQMSLNATPVQEQRPRSATASSGAAKTPGAAAAVPGALTSDPEEESSAESETSSSEEEGEAPPEQAHMTLDERRASRRSSRRASLNAIELPLYKRGVWGAAEAASSADASGGAAPSSPPGGSMVIAFGDGQRGQLSLDRAGLSRHIATGEPTTLVEELRGQEPVQVLAAGVASFVLGARGHVWAFGSNRQLELGLRKDLVQVHRPTHVKVLRDKPIVQVASSTTASGQAHTALLTKEGEVFMLGSSARGALGQGPEVHHSAPTILRMTQELPIRLVACGAHHTVLVTDLGRVFTFGDNSYGQLGIGQASVPYRDVPHPLDSFTLKEGKVRLLAVGDNHNLAVVTKANLFAWGANANGQLGLGRCGDEAEPKLVKGLAEAQLTSLACGSRHSLAVAWGGNQLFAWGSNAEGQLGTGPSTFEQGQQVVVPTLVQTLSNKRGLAVVQVAAAAFHSFALTRLGEVFGFGDNTYGQLGFVPEGRRQRGATGESGTLGTRAAREVDAPRLHAEGVARLWLPERIVGLGRWQITAVSTAEMHSLALAL